MVSNTNFRPILIGEVSKNCMELSNLSEEKLIILRLQVMFNFDVLQRLRHDQLPREHNRDLRAQPGIAESVMRFLNCLRLQAVTDCDEFWRLVQYTIHELTVRIRRRYWMKSTRHSSFRGPVLWHFPLSGMGTTGQRRGPCLPVPASHHLAAD